MANDLLVMKDKSSYEAAVSRFRSLDILLPTYEQLCDPSKIPDSVKKELEKISVSEIHPRNLFRISWHNEPKEMGGSYGGVNFVEYPKELTGCKARIIALVGKHFPTGAHKVLAAYGPLVTRLVSGKLNPDKQKCIWPSTGNYCRGGAFDSRLMGCVPIAVLPQGMSKERFDWLEKEVQAEVHPTPGTESNVKEIYDKVKQLVSERGSDVVVMNQFDDMSNPISHFKLTGSAMEEVFEEIKTEKSRFSGIALSQGSAGTLASADYIKRLHPLVKLGVSEALQCPTLLYNGFGEHRIEGIGDKHVPWIHNLRSTDLVVDLDDDHCMRLLRLFNEKEGKDFLKSKGVPADFVDNSLPLLGISGIANLLSAIKMAKYFEWDENDCIFTVMTDSIALYGSRLQELNQEMGDYSLLKAAADFEILNQQTIANMLETTYWDKKRCHNLKYYTWIEQQGRDVKDLNDQWHQLDWYDRFYDLVPQIDTLINQFNKDTGLASKYCQ